MDALRTLYGLTKESRWLDVCFGFWSAIAFDFFIYVASRRNVVAFNSFYDYLYFIVLYFDIPIDYAMNFVDFVTA